MRQLRILIGAALILVVAVVVGACEDSPRRDSTQPPSVSATTPAVTGSPPVLTGHVTELFPAYGGSISQSETRTLDPMLPQPPCFAVDFTGLAEQGLWFRVLLDGSEVTAQLTWVAQASGDSERPPRACYATEAGLPPGNHTMVIVVRAPFEQTAPALETITWSFTVTP